MEERDRIEQPHGGALTPFRPGESGNPNGRPQGTVSLPALINKILDGETTFEEYVNKEGKPIPLSRRAKIWLKIVLDAENDEDAIIRMKAADLLANRTEGKPGQNIDLTTGGDKLQNPLTALPLEQQTEILMMLNKNDGG